VPKIFKDISSTPRHRSGDGPHGSGKSTTLAAMINQRQTKNEYGHC